VIGDCRTAALVSRDGSIDWLCWPRFDSPSIFAALLDESAGYWHLAPTMPFETVRSYIDDTNILQTRFQSPSGSAVLTDLMPVASEEAKRTLLTPDHEILRIIECEQGEIDVQMRLEPRPDYAGQPPSIRGAGRLGIKIETGEGLLVLRTDLPLEHVGASGVRASARLRAGERRYASLTFADEWPTILPPLGDWSQQAVTRSVSWWQQWVSRITYDGPARDAVVRSALVLKLLAYAPSGAVVAAPTTSLPERIGGDLNWDYRFCWLRDASLTVRALFGLGCVEEADAFIGWLLHSTRLTQPALRILYDVYGNMPDRERILKQLGGYYGSRPVRVGNAATEQLQLDVYGEVIDAVAHFVGTGGTLDRETQRMLSGFGEYVCKHWNEPDEGIWEPRSGKGHNTHSRVLCWTALDRLLQLHEKGYLRAAPVADFQRNRELIRNDVFERAGIKTSKVTLPGSMATAWTPVCCFCRGTVSKTRGHIECAKRTRASRSTSGRATVCCSDIEPRTHPGRARSESAASGAPNTSRSAAERSRKRKPRSSAFLPTPTMSGCSLRKLIPRPEMRSATSRRRSHTLA